MVAMRLPTLLLAVLSLLPLSACGESADRTDPATLADDLARARAAAFFMPGIKRNLDQARAALAPLIARPSPEPEDLLRAAIIELHDTKADLGAGRALIERAAAALPDDLRVRWVRGLYAHAFSYQDGELERARDDFAAVVAADPDDAAARIQLADALDGLGDMAGALDQCRAVRALGLGPNTPFYLTATHKLSTGLFRTARSDEARAQARALSDEKLRLEGAGPEDTRPKPASDEALKIGHHGDVPPPAPRLAADGPPRPPSFPAFTSTGTRPAGGAVDLLVRDLDGDGALELVRADASGVHSQPASGGEPTLLVSGSATRVVAADLDDGTPLVPTSGDADPVIQPPRDLELLAVVDGRALLLERDATDEAWVSRELASSGVRDASFSDLDHDGGLDVLLATETGVRWLRNDGAPEGGARVFTDATPEGFAIGPVDALLSEDFDDNQAIDVLALGGGRLVALAGLWSARFEDRSAAWNLGSVVLAADTRALCDDLDGDGRADLLLAEGAGYRALLNTGEGFGRPLPVALDRPRPTHALLDDIDGDGRIDLLGRDATGAVVAWAGPLVGRTAPIPGALLAEGEGLGPLLLADWNGDQALDLLAADADGVTVLHGARPAGGSLTLSLEGHKDNALGVGSVLRVLIGDVTRRVFWRGEPRVLGLAGRDALDVLFIRWPNGVLQRAFDLAAGATHALPQDDGLVGSCPFLYTWNGETYEFISDVLGATPLGLPMAPGMLVPFDHDEYVKVRGDQLVPRDGRLELVLSEELREVTYLDRLRLHAIDHPASVEIQPNEAFVFPPFPEHHVHTLRDVQPVARAVASDGSDVTELLAAVDDRHARPFVPRAPRFRGLTEPWHLDLSLAETAEQRAALAAAPRIRLALTGWLLWGDASVNLSAARHPDVSFDPPLLWVPDGDGWRPAGPPIGFITGKTKTMLVDVTDVLDRDDPRLRLSTTLALHWDAIRVVLDGDDAPFVDTALEPSAAVLAFRGFSAKLPDPSGEIGERFRFDQLMAPRWDQHPGRYTRYGDVLPLLGAVDDRTVIFGAGDALAVHFDASALPPVPEGWTRDWLLFLDGWAKDRDPNTLACRTVEPLPFHAMSSYPPPADEPFPDTPELTAWIAEWNTRDGQVLIETLAEAAARLPARD